MDDVIPQRTDCSLVPGPQTFLSRNVQTAVTGTTLRFALYLVPLVCVCVEWYLSYACAKAMYSGQ